MGSTSAAAAGETAPPPDSGVILGDFSQMRDTICSYYGVGPQLLEFNADPSMSASQPPFDPPNTTHVNSFPFPLITLITLNLLINLLALQMPRSTGEDMHRHILILESFIHEETRKFNVRMYACMHV